MLSFDPYYDDHGFLCMADKDGGDSAQKTGLYRFGRYIKFRNDPAQLGRESAKFEQELDGFEDLTVKNTYRRHPDKTKWYSRPSNFSRDQQRSIVMAMGSMKNRKRLWGIFLKHVLRGGFYQNNRQHDDATKFNFPDFASPDHWAEYVRAFYMSGLKFVAVLYPLVLLADLCATIGLISNFFQWKDPEEADDDNLIMSTLQAKFAMPTPISWMNRKLYKKYRPLAGTYREGLMSATEMSGAETAICYKHRPSTGAPPFGSLYCPILKEHL